MINTKLRLHYSRDILTYTACGFPIYYMRITSNKSDRKKKSIFITSRVHPGETHSSFIFNGILKFLLSNNPEAKYLRKHYYFFLVPCMNPDGVILGNSRVNALGYDLNR